jgi:hypothetical protein
MASTFDLFPWLKNFVINPVTDWQRFINPQFNVTINQGDAAIENHVLARAGSYGKQLGRMQEVLDVLVKRLPPPPLSATELRSIDKYRETRKQIVGAVKEAKQDDTKGASTAEFERWLDALAALRDADPERFEDYADRLKDLVAPTPPKRPAAHRSPPASSGNKPDSRKP